MAYVHFFVVIAFLVVFILLVGYALRAGISPMPSSAAARRAVLTQVRKANPGTIIECGSGWGGMALALARAMPEARVVGYELSPIPWLVSWIRKKLQSLDNLTLYRGDFLQGDLSQGDILIAYLYPKGMARLGHKLKQQKAAATLLSVAFALPASEPIRVSYLGDLFATPIYVYRIGCAGGSERFCLQV